MHRILLRRLYVDTPSEMYERTRDFWATALVAQPHRGVNYPEFHWLEHPAALGQVFVQDIGATPIEVPRRHRDRRCRSRGRAPARRRRV